MPVDFLAWPSSFTDTQYLFANKCRTLQNLLLSKYTDNGLIKNMATEIFKFRKPVFGKSKCKQPDLQFQTMVAKNFPANSRCSAQKLFPPTQFSKGFQQ